MALSCYLMIGKDVVGYVDIRRLDPDPECERSDYEVEVHGAPSLVPDGMLAAGRVEDFERKRGALALFGEAVDSLRSTARTA